MKKVILFLTFITFSFTSFAQNKATTEDGRQVILNNNGTWQYSNNEESQKQGLPAFTDKTFNWENGYGSIVQVKFTNLLQGDKTIDRDLFTQMTIHALLISKNNLKNKVSYVPRDMAIMKGAKEGYVVKVTYLGKNSYGSESENSTMFLYDDNGEFMRSF